MLRELSMLLPVFRDLIKPQWRAVLGELKLAGALPVSELARKVGASYMAVKQQCEELKKLGYLERSRVPRTAVGRPEIFYSLSSKADALFPEAGVDFTLDLLRELKGLSGESMPDKLLFQYFQKLHLKWQPLVSSATTLPDRIEKLVSLRRAAGCHLNCELEQGFVIEEYHNPLQRIFQQYPRAVGMELRMIEGLLGVRVNRRELAGGRGGQVRVVFELQPLSPAASLTPLT